MGRRRVEIKKIDNRQARFVTFSKRRKGLFKKAAELSQLFNVDVAAVVFSPAGSIFEFGNTPLVLDRYLAGGQASSVGSDHGHNCDSLISKIESKLSINISNLALTEVEEYSRVLEKMKGDVLRCLEEKETRINQCVEGENNLSAHDGLITIDNSENQNEEYGFSLGEVMSMNYHENAWMMAQVGGSSDTGMTKEELDSLLEELMTGNNLSAHDAMITVDSSENQNEGFGLSLEEVMSMNNHEDAWMMAGDGDGSDMGLTKEELDSLFEGLIMGNNNCNQDFGVIDDFSTLVDDQLLDIW